VTSAVVVDCSLSLAFVRMEVGPIEVGAETLEFEYECVSWSLRILILHHLSCVLVPEILRHFPMMTSLVVNRLCGSRTVVGRTAIGRVVGVVLLAGL
jgi:hypothetical protein